jgi:sigma-54 dependent transcriptional regulator, acetoin dehydrogenase operon transcriptional activator AcoR
VSDDNPLSSTLEVSDERVRRAVAFRTFLFLVLEGRRPIAGSARYTLCDVNEVTIGRGQTRSVTREAIEDGTRLAIRCPDRLMSGLHARLKRSATGWTIEDLGSTNGTLLDGKRVTSAELPASATIGLGATLFRFHAAHTAPAGSIADHDTESASRVPQGVQTVIPFYATKLADFARIADSQVPVLLLGETGTGKEVMARALHQLSRRSGAFVPVNCGAMPQTLVESQLFGHVRGAFSGALKDEPGLVRSADGGTLFLDEIGDLPQTSQAALLRVLQEREVLPVGATRAVPVDLRIVAATHRPVGAHSSQFRADLFARLSGFTLKLPALRDRLEDLGILIADILKRVAPGKELHFSSPAAAALLAYDWPLNVRELEQALSVASVLATDGVIDVTHLPAQVTGTASGVLPPDPKRKDSGRPEPAGVSPEDEQLRAQLVTSLQTHRGNVTDVAKALGRTRMQIHRWMKRFHIDPENYRS